MNAGQAIGLLAGLGALNALRGGRDGAGPRFTGLLDMIDGGGAGRSGDRFEGGGLLSVLGNLFAKPYEAQDRVERIATDARSATGGMTLRPRARPEMVSRNNVEPINAYGAVPALPSRNNAEPVGPYGGMPPVMPSRSNEEPVGMYNMPPVAQAVSGMPTPMPTQSRFGPDGPQSSEDFALIHAEIQRDLGIRPSQLFDMISNDPDQYDRLVSMYSRYGGSAMSGIHSTPAQRVVSSQPESQSLRDTFRSAYSATPFSASSLF
jgi:hypothetical protein